MGKMGGLQFMFTIDCWLFIDEKLSAGCVLTVVLMHMIFLSDIFLIEDRIRKTCLWSVQMFVASNAGRLASMFLCLMNRVGLGYGVAFGIAQVIRRHLRYSSLKRTLYPYNHELP